MSKTPIPAPRAASAFTKTRAVPFSAAACALLICTLPAAAETFNYDGAVAQQYNVTTTGVYEIVAYGAQGGAGNNSGGLGAEVEGYFNLVGGETLTIDVGGQGGTFEGDGGGGGGTFVLEDGTLLEAAGGGGGGSAGPSGNGLATASSSSGGADGGAYGGGGGAGFSSNGETSTDDGGAGGQDYANGLGGGLGSDAGNGGFGGGGGGGAFGGGGGGGYSGGAGGSGVSAEGGDGGGSYIDGIATDTTLTAGAESANGEVIITEIPETNTAVTPEPGTLSLLGLGLTSVAGLVHRRRRA